MIIRQTRIRVERRTRVNLNNNWKCILKMYPNVLIENSYISFLSLLLRLHFFLRSNIHVSSNRVKQVDSDTFHLNFYRFRKETKPTAKIIIPYRFQKQPSVFLSQSAYASDLNSKWKDFWNCVAALLDDDMIRAKKESSATWLDFVSLKRRVQATGPKKKICSIPRWQ